MQETLTFNNLSYLRIYKKSKRKNSFLFVFVCIIFCGILIITFSTLKKEYNNDYFLSKNYYFLSLSNFSSYLSATRESDAIKNRGGAGYIYKHLNRYHVIASAYYSKDDYDKLEKTIKTEYPNLECVSIKASSVKKTIKNQIYKQQELYQLYILLQEQIEKIYKSSFNLENVNVVYRELTQSIIDLNYAIKKCEKIDNSKIKQKVVLSAEVVKEKIQNCIDQIYINSSIQKEVNNLVVSLFMENIELRKSLS